MGREVRMVPADWRHPQDQQGRYIPLLDSDYEDAIRQWEEDELPEWLEGARLWSTGFVKTSSEGVVPISKVVEDAKASRPYAGIPDPPTYEWWAGDIPSRPKRENYMPSWSDAERTHFMMYEDTSEGTPMSPAFATAEELAHWLADTSASAFAGQIATYQQWLATIRRGWAISAVIQGGIWMSGVEFNERDAEPPPS